MCIISKAPFEYLKIEDIKLPDCNAQHEDLIVSTIKKHAGEGADVIIKYTNEYQFSKSGKKLYFKSN